MGMFGMGQPVPRTEDPRLLKGCGQYVSDLEFPDMVWGYTVRSPFAHADILAIDTTRPRRRRVFSRSIHMWTLKVRAMA